MMPRTVAALLLSLAAAAPARAHALGAEAKLRGGRVEVEAYFSDNTPARDARVTVRDAADATIAEGRTDAEGRWSFPAPPPGRYAVVVDAGAGHRTRPIAVTIPGEPPAADVTVSEGPRREEFTQFPWGRVALGLGIIAALALGWRAVRRARAVRSPTPPSARTP
ncbi:MAG TPA: carboxypeptidase-like regulatory domain-containing protein [Gemmataceae bacterium]|jgi:hypothetical protein